MTTDSNSYDALIAEGMTASQAGESARAISCFLQASECQPAAGLPQFLLGSEYAADQDMDKAEAAFANATRLAPGFPLARYQLGLLQFSSGRAAAALLTWQPLLGLPDSDPLSHFVKGFNALAMDRFDEAMENYEHGLALNKDNAALSNDIRSIVAGIEALRSTTASAAEPAGNETPHVLLANYQQQGRAH